MEIRIKATDPETGQSKILSREQSIKIGHIIINTEIAKEAFLGYIDFEYKGLKFCRVDI